MPESIVTIGADLSKLRRELSKLPNMTDDAAQKMLVALERQVVKSEKAAKAAAKRMSKASKKASKEAEDGFRAAAEATKEMGDKAGDAESSINAMAGLMGLFSEEAEKSMQVVAEFGGGFEGATKAATGLGIRLGSVLAVLGPIAVTVAAGAAAWNHYSKELEAVEERMKAAAAAASEMQAINAAITSALDTAELERAVAMGEESVDVLRARNAQLQAEATFEDAIAKARARRLDLQKQFAALEQQHNEELRSAFTNTETLLEIEGKLASTRMMITASDQQLAAYDDRVAIHAATLLETAAAADIKAEADRQASDAAARAAAVESAAAAAMRDREAAAAAKAGALEQTKAIETAATQALMSELELLDVQYANEIARLRELDAVHLEHAATREAMMALEQQHVEQKREIMSKNSESDQEALLAQQEANSAMLAEAHGFSGHYADVFKHQEKLIGETFKGTTREINAGMSQNLAATSTNILKFSDTMSTFMRNQGMMISQLMDEMHAAGLAKNKKLATAMFYVEKAMKLAQIAITTPRIAIAAIEPPPVGYGNNPLGWAMFAATAALGVTQAAIVASQKPQFHQGGMVTAPDEVQINALKGEGVLTPTGVESIGGEEGLAAANRGEGTGGQIVVVHQYQHRTFNAFIQDNLKIHNSPLRNALAAQRVGHRER